MFDPRWWHIFFILFFLFVPFRSTLSNPLEPTPNEQEVAQTNNQTCQVQTKKSSPKKPSPIPAKITELGRQQTISAKGRSVFHWTFFSSPSFRYLSFSIYSNSPDSRARLTTIISFVWRLEQEEASVIVKSFTKTKTDQQVIDILKALPKVEPNLESRFVFGCFRAYFLEFVQTPN